MTRQIKATVDYFPCDAEFSASIQCTETELKYILYALNCVFIKEYAKELFKKIILLNNSGNGIEKCSKNLI